MSDAKPDLSDTSKRVNDSKTSPTIDIRKISRAVASVAVGVVHTVERVMVGDARARTARGNAWEAVCADRERAYQREEIRRIVAALAAAPAKPAERQPIGSHPVS